MGKIVGAAAVNIAKQIKQGVGNLPVPTAVTAVEIALTDGSRIRMPVVETKRLEDIVLQMKASSEKLDMLDGGTAAGRQAVKETAAEGLSEVAQKGAKALKNELPKEALMQAKNQLVTLNVARTELIARIDNLINNGNLLKDTKLVLGKARNSLEKNLKQDDLIGALRDVFNKPVRRSGDGYLYQHSKEVEQGLESLDNAKDILLTELSRKTKSSDEFVKLSQEIDAIKEMQRRINIFLETK